MVYKSTILSLSIIEEQYMNIYTIYRVCRVEKEGRFASLKLDNE